jgi:hypothetical protein
MKFMSWSTGIPVYEVPTRSVEGRSMEDVTLKVIGAPKTDMMELREASVPGTASWMSSSVVCGGKYGTKAWLKSPKLRPD